MMYKYKKDFPIFKNTKFYNKDLVYLDNGATTQKPQIVIDEFAQFYENSNSNIYRGVYRLSEEALSPDLTISPLLITLRVEIFILSSIFF